MNLFPAKSRHYWQAAFFALFLLAPVFNLFRMDLYEGHFYFLGMPWEINLDSLLAQTDAPIALSMRIFMRVLLPVVSFIAITGWLIWRYGRIYCGWLCPHFSVVEMVNRSFRKTFSKLSFWDKDSLPIEQLDGTHIESNKKWWPVTAFIVIFFSWLWAVTLLTYLLPPKLIWSNLIHLELTRNQLVFITVATFLFSLEFTLARHLFCRYACAVGLFQSLIWMANKKSMVVGFDRSRAKACSDCDASCEHACPMRIKPRHIKRHKLTCVQCQSCVSACEAVQKVNHQPSLLKMVDGACALGESERGFGKRPQLPEHCFEEKN